MQIPPTFLVKQVCECNTKHQKAPARVLFDVRNAMLSQSSGGLQLTHTHTHNTCTYERNARDSLSVYMFYLDNILFLTVEILYLYIYFSFFERILCTLIGRYLRTFQ